MPTGALMTRRFHRIDRATRLTVILCILHYNSAGAVEYTKPEWKKDGPPSMYRAHWRYQACKVLGIAESALPESVTTALKSYLWPTALDTTRAERSAWLVKTPKFVSNAWHEAAAANKSSAHDDDDAMGEADDAIGKIQLFVDPFQKDAQKAMTFCTMELSGQEASGVPKSYILANQPSDMPMHVFSDVREGSTTGPDITLEAKVNLKLDMRPRSVDDVDYHRVSKERMIKAQTKTRVTQSSSEMRFAPLPKARNLVRFTDAAVKAKTEKKERMEKKALENLVFTLFERQSYWSLKQLLLETNQPGDWLKQTLNEIAVLNRRGPNMGLWSLQDMYKNQAAK
mmetsp:Transcript_1024/g.3752  ORF Transcript_1024/g.3752 Transcript_1024/m.3752 type:complete len:341 (-) Transcript_1024:68-1090(-)